MDLETENRLAVMLMREAAELRRQAEKEGVLAYLRQPYTRARPNSRFLTATVLGVQQANRSVEVKEMWRVRENEKELDKRIKDISRDKSSSGRSHRKVDLDRDTFRHARADDSINASASCSSKRESENYHEVLTNEELDKFLHSRKKRGRGDIGARMDETGPYLPRCSDEEPVSSPEVQKSRVIYGPVKPPSLKSYESSEEELHEKRRKKAKKVHLESSDKKKRRSKEDSKHKKTKRKEKRRHHH
ncbi:hypothetical protein L6164_036454 [Bauhinia variegata]|uniref:Uncharacterized protein n=1 Tax=Bauhinia variegata TaxID=167791 RepID=A0ACB9KH88_BAUVA|nr:hypothetical protein L6164_036454 [Bauhinia variegata]